jgi:AraC-like DNA-binding protein
LVVHQDLQMSVAASDLVLFSTDALPERDRIAVWREVFGRHVIRLQVEALAEVDFFQRSLVRRLPGLSLMTTVSSGFRAERTRPLMVDGNDDIILTINTEGIAQTCQLGRDATIRPGDGVLLSSAYPGMIHYPIGAKRISLALKRGEVAASLANDPEVALGRRLARETEALRLLTTYVTALDDCVLSSPALRHAFVTHVHDLVSLVLGATRDGTEIAQNRGLRAARLSAIKADIADGIGDRGLSVTEIARRHRVTPRYIQMLFEAEGTTFSEYVIKQRLTRAYRMLVDQRFADRTISAVAFEVGFGNLSYFNRVFRRRYGGAPSDVRASVQQRD